MPHPRIHKVAFIIDPADLDTASSIELTVTVLLDAEVGVLAVAVERGADDVAGGVGGDVEASTDGDGGLKGGSGGGGGGRETCGVGGGTARGSVLRCYIDGSGYQNCDHGAYDLGVDAVAMREGWRSCGALRYVRNCLPIPHMGQRWGSTDCRCGCRNYQTHERCECETE